MSQLSYTAHRRCLHTFYQQNGLKKYFEKDNDYLEKSFRNIQQLWLDNFNQIHRVNYLMIAEAPLWGKNKKYIYNHASSNTQFFYRSDLADVLKKDIPDKKTFLDSCNEIGFLIIDISPFALNPTDTKINYRQLSTKDYCWLVSATLPAYFETKMELIRQKVVPSVKVFFRYVRVKQAFHSLVAPLLLSNGLIKKGENIGDISQSGGGICKEKLRSLIFSG